MIVSSQSQTTNRDPRLLPWPSRALHVRIINTSTRYTMELFPRQPSAWLSPPIASPWGPWRHRSLQVVVTIGLRLATPKLSPTIYPGSRQSTPSQVAFHEAFLVLLPSPLPLPLPLVICCPVLVSLPKSLAHTLILQPVAPSTNPLSPPSLLPPSLPPALAH